MQNKEVKHYAYMLRCADDTIYSGYTTDLLIIVGLVLNIHVRAFRLNWYIMNRLQQNRRR